MFTHPNYFSILGICGNCAFSFRENGVIWMQGANTWQFANLANLQSKLYSTRLRFETQIPSVLNIGFALMRPDLAGLSEMKRLSAMVGV
jgi:hypothetical protein